MTLPLDYARCEPEMPDQICRQCARWAKLPGQTWGERTPVRFGIEHSMDEGCDYIKERSDAGR